MATALTKGRLEPNKTQVGGIKNVYFAEYGGTTYSGATISADEEITAFGSALTLYKYETKGGTGFSQSNPNDRATGTSFQEISGTITLKKQDLSTRKELKLMSYERLHIITEDYNGDFKMYGIENGCEVSVETQDGTAMGDLTGYVLTVTGQERFPAFFVDSAIIDNTTDTSVTVGT